MNTTRTPPDPLEALRELYGPYGSEPALRELAGRPLVQPRPVPGRGPIPPKAIFIGEAPGAVEARQGVPFTGPSGQLMERQMRIAGLDPGTFWFTNAVKIRPPRNRTPEDDELDASRPYLMSELAIVGKSMPAGKMRLIVALGGTAATILRDHKVSIGRVAGTFEDLIFAESGSWKVLYSYHPAAALRTNAIRQEFSNGLAQAKLYLDA